MAKHSIWVERHRPRSIADVIFQDERQKQAFENFVANDDIPNLMLAGVQGTGKTTISKALVRDLGVPSEDVLRINCSDEKIDAMRDRVTMFAQTLPMGRFKVVQLEEFDYLSAPAQALLRGLIEDSSATCRYIATCNYDSKVIPALKSRFQQFSFKSPDKEHIAVRMAGILDAEAVEYDIDDLLTYIDVGYPDIRKTIQLLQQNTQAGKLLSPKAVSADSDWKFGLLDALTQCDFKRARKLVCEGATREEHEEVFTFLYQNIGKITFHTKDGADQAIVLIAEHMTRYPLASDTEILLASLFIQLGQL